MKTNNQPMSPFMDTLSFELETPLSSADLAARETDDSPFRSVYELENERGTIDVTPDPHAEMMYELYDNEFNYAIYDVANRIADLNEMQFEQEAGGYAVSPSARVQRLYEHCVPLMRETDLFFEALDHEFDQQPDNEAGDSAVQQFIDQYQVQQPLAPEFEQFWGRLKKAAKKGWNAAKKYAKKKLKQGWKYAKNKAKALGRRLLRMALKKLKKYVRPWFEKIVKYAIDKLPAQYRPIAKIAAEKLGIKLNEQEMADDVIDTAAEIQYLQHEFNRVTTDLMLAGSEVEQDQVLAEAMMPLESAESPVERLYQARQQFKEGLLTLGEAEEPTQLVENFIPAVLGLAKIGIKFYGRPKLIRFLARYVARLIRKFVPRQYLKPLSRAIVDAGLRLIKLEATDEDVNEVALEAISDTVEETVRRVAALPEHVLENEALLEGFVLEAFEQAATTNLPPVLPENVYVERPELRESMLFNGVWAKQPFGGRKLYKKYTHVFDTLLTPNTAKKIKIWRGRSLASSIRRRLRLKRLKKRMKARVHVYEATPGTWLSRIAKHETEVAGLGSSSRNAWEQLMPLTEEAAAILLGEPRLGRTMPDRYLADPLKIGVGQRFYYLELPSEQPMSRVPVAARCCNTHLELNFAQNRLNSAIFLSEDEAQRIAVALRQKVPLGATLIVLNNAIQAGVKLAFGSGALHQMRLIHGGIDVQNSSAAALNWLPPQLLAQFKTRLIQWQLQHVSRYLQEQPNAFVAAVDDPAQGVTLHIALHNPPGQTEIGRFLAGASMSLVSLQVPDRLPRADLQIRAGYAT